MLGSIVPSSRYLIRRLLREVDWRSVRTVVEFGPGVGNITAAVLERMPDQGRLIALDTNEEFITALRRTITDPRLVAVNASAEHVRHVVTHHRVASVDCVISGIPFSMIPRPVGSSILKQVEQLLSPRGTMLVYQFSAAVKPALQEVFAEVEQEFEWLNILPAHVFRCRRRDEE